MIKFTAKGSDGRRVLGLGLSFRNLKEFRDKPGNTYIEIDGAELGLDFDVIIFSGRTEAEMARTHADMIGPNTADQMEQMARASFPEQPGRRTDINTIRFGDFGGAEVNEK